MANPIVQAARRSKTIVILWTIYNNYMIWLKTKPAAWFGFLADARTEIHPVEVTLDWIRINLNDYLVYGSLGPDDIRDRTILEIGPGDNFGVALGLIARGARQVVCLDKFYTIRDESEQANIYRAVLDTFNDEERRLAEAAIRVTGDRVERNEDRIRYICGRGIEDAAEILDPGSFDIILSRAVLEHLFDLDQAYDTLDQLSRPGAIHLHKVDFRDHNIFSGKGMHPLTFLTISDRIWKMMSYHSGKPNRRLVNDYRQIFQRLGYQAEVHTAIMLADDVDLEPYVLEPKLGVHYGDRDLRLIEELRPKLLPRYRQLSDLDLAMASAFFVARKPV